MGFFSRNALSLRQIQHLLIHEPLKIVRLEHSPKNKELILKGLAVISKDPRGATIFNTLEEFLRDVAPKHNLTPDQDGARVFLLRAMEKASPQAAHK